MFFNVPKNFETVSTNPSSSNFVGDHAGDEYSKYHLGASAPYLSKSWNGSTVFPFDLLIFLPFLSNIKSFTTTFLYGALPLIKVDIAINV